MKSSIRVSRGGNSITFRGAAANAAFKAFTEPKAEVVYDKAYFIAKFEAIPDELWCIESLRASNGGSCSLGHCLAPGQIYSEECIALAAMFWKSGLLHIAKINDGLDERYQQLGPKARVLAALRDLP